MDTTLLGALSAFLRTLAAGQHPDAVARAAVESFSTTFAAESSAILTLRGRSLVTFGVHGYREEELAAMQAMPVDGDYPLSRALREGEIVIDLSSTLSERYRAARRAGGSWQATRQRLPEGTVVSVPLLVAGRPVGGFGLLCSSQRDWRPADIAVLEAAAHALAMWLTHPDSGLPTDDPADPPALTPRQVSILSLVAVGRSNAEIGQALGCSESTVKQEMQRILRTLGAPGRQEAASRASALGLIDEEALR